MNKILREAGTKIKSFSLGFWLILSYSYYYVNLSLAFYIWKNKRVTENIHFLAKVSQQAKIVGPCSCHIHGFFHRII